MKKANNSRKVRPGRSIEAALYAEGYLRVAGLDEAGRGALAGPVVAAAVILPQTAGFDWLERVRDSKMLAEEEREDIFKLMQQSGIDIGIGVISSQVIDDINILNATRQAMKLALRQLNSPPDYVLTDAVYLRGLSIPQKGIIKGDRDVISIACASVAAKVTRDRIMAELDLNYPCYGFCRHKGYGTKEHLDCLRQYGASEIHRLTFAPVRDLSKLI